MDDILPLATVETLVVLVAPLLILYQMRRWPQRIVIPCMVLIPVLWYLTYAPIHELSHVLGAYLAGGSVTEIKLIPSFWKGEFAGAWITPQGLREPWQQLVMTSAPYVLDGLSLMVGFFALGRGRLMDRPFALGVAFMLLCLRPAFDVLCETVAFALGAKADLYHIALAIGTPMLWLSSAILLGFSLLTITRLLVKSAAR
ncbi:MAG: hypothetical protein JNL73_00955, partial [Anaerolineales bacterium]|nr:hypothetical protein [Anaerolineales bacterium]